MNGSSEVLIVGAGAAGLSCALALQTLGLRVRVVEPTPPATLRAPPFDGRELALTHTTVAILQRLGIWALIPAAEISRLQDACVLDGDAVHGLHISHGDGRAAELGYLVPHHRIREAAAAQVCGSGIEVLAGRRVLAIERTAGGIAVRLDDGQGCSARLVVAADSRFSETRRALGIGARTRDFGKTMLVCRARHTLPHGQVAYEWFDYGCTLALLPLNGNCASVVVTVTPAEAERLRDLPEPEFNAWVEARFRGRFGAMALCSERILYPLIGVYPDRLVSPGYALIGDAAVGMHPVTAHGLNLGLLGVDTLSRCVGRALRAHQDFASERVLGAYQRAQRLASWPLYHATNALVALYTSEAPAQRLARAALLRTAQGLPPVRRLIARALTRTAPRWLPRA